LPSIDANNPDHPAVLQSFVNAHRWTRLNRLRESNDIKDEPLLGVWNSAIQVHPYQLEAVIRALCMLRACLLLAGKTIQAIAAHFPLPCAKGVFAPTGRNMPARGRVKRGHPRTSPRVRGRRNR
jgi:hypothetical protein